MSGDLKAFLKATEAMPGNVRVIFNAAKEVEDEELVEEEVEEAPESKPLRKKNLDNLVGEDMD